MKSSKKYMKEILCVNLTKKIIQVLYFKLNVKMIMLTLMSLGAFNILKWSLLC